MTRVFLADYFQPLSFTRAHAKTINHETLCERWQIQKVFILYVKCCTINMNPGVGCIVVTVPQLTDVHSLKLKTAETQYASVTLLIINSCQSAPEFIYNIIYLCRLFLAEFWIWFCLSSCRRIQSHQITFNNRRLSLRPNQMWRQPKSNGFLNVDQRLVYFLHQTHCDCIRWLFFF